MTQMLREQDLLDSLTRQIKWNEMILDQNFYKNSSVCTMSKKNINVLNMHACNERNGEK